MSALAIIMYHCTHESPILETGERVSNVLLEWMSQRYGLRTIVVVIIPSATAAVAVVRHSVCF